MSPSPVPSPGRENNPAIPSLPLHNRLFSAWGRGAVCLGPSAPGVPAQGLAAWDVSADLDQRGRAPTDR